MKIQLQRKRLNIHKNYSNKSDTFYRNLRNRHREEDTKYTHTHINTTKATKTTKKINLISKLRAK